MIYKIYYKEHVHDMLLTSSSNDAYKYLWADIDCEYPDGCKKDEPLIFDRAEDAFEFIEKEKDHFGFSDKCFVIVQK